MKKLIPIFLCSLLALTSCNKSSTSSVSETSVQTSAQTSQSTSTTPPPSTESSSSTETTKAIEVKTEPADLNYKAKINAFNGGVAAEDEDNIYYRNCALNGNLCCYNKKSKTIKQYTDFTIYILMVRLRFVNIF